MFCMYQYNWMNYPQQHSCCLTTFVLTKPTISPHFRNNVNAIIFQYNYTYESIIHKLEDIVCVLQFCELMGTYEFLLKKKIFGFNIILELILPMTILRAHASMLENR